MKSILHLKRQLDDLQGAGLLRESRVTLPEGIAAIVGKAAELEGISVQKYVTACVCRDLSALLASNTEFAAAFNLSDDPRARERIAWRLAGIPKLEPSRVVTRLLRAQKGGRR